MDAARHERISRLFAEVRELDPAARRALLAERCADDPTLIEEVESLLAHHERPAVVIGTAAVDVAKLMSAMPVEAEGPESGAAFASVARYTIVRRLGEGGMGAVYLAEQDRPRRTVALKIMRPGLAGAEKLRRRFELEAEVLGRLEHPGIARIYDAGTAEVTTPEGRSVVPYFAMEFVDGPSLVAYATERRLGTRARMALVALVAEAVAAAHRQGIVHRDLKPANILVASGPDGAPQPKVLDFGVARALDSDIAVTTMQTDIGQLVGTLGYMSPEQVAGDPSRIDARSDVYALGAVAWELLAGRPLVDARAGSVPEIARAIRDVDATRLSSVDRVFRGDLDTIVAKALEKDPARRYRDAAEFAADIRRYLDHEPIVARPPTTLYQLGKFTRRNRVLVAGVLATFVVLVLGLIGTSIGLVQAERRKAEAIAAQQRADRRFDQLRALAKSVVFEFDDLIVDLPGSTVARKSIVSTATAYLDGLADEAEDPDLLMELSEGYMRIGQTQGYHSKANLGDRAGALESFGKALAIRERMLAADPENAVIRAALARTQNAIANVRFTDGQLESALEAFRAVLATREELFAADPEGKDRRRDVFLSHQFIGNVLREMSVRAARAGDEAATNRGREEALASYRTALAMAIELERPEDRRSVRDRSVAEEKVGDALGDLGREEEAIGHFRESLRIRRALLAETPDDIEARTDVAASTAKIGSRLLVQARFADAEPLLRDAWTMTKAAVDADAANVLAKVNHVVSEFRLAQLAAGKAGVDGVSPDEARRLRAEGVVHLDRAVGTLKALDAEDKLGASRRAWIPEMEAMRERLAAE